MSTTPERHLSAESFTNYLRAGVPIEHPIPGSPRLVLFIDPNRPRIGLRGPAKPNEKPDGSGLENLTVHAVHRDQRRMIEIAISDAKVFMDAYPLLCAVADRVQTNNQSMTTALAETLRRLGHLLRPEDTPSREFEAGLLGELRVLAGLARAFGPGPALESWRGGQGEEHDFGLPGHDLEVKTTTSERRNHWITSLTQLVPTGDRPLWLVSIQITGAGAGGVTLGDVVSRTREVFAAADDADRFDSRLQVAGWRDRYASRCTQRWRTRSTPAIFAVTAGFPRLTPDLLTQAGVASTEVTDVRYRIDLTGRPEDQCPDVLTETLTAGQGELP